MPMVTCINTGYLLHLWVIVLANITIAAVVPIILSSPLNKRPFTRNEDRVKPRETKKGNVAHACLYRGTALLLEGYCTSFGGCTVPLLGGTSPLLEGTVLLGESCTSFWGYRTSFAGIVPFGGYCTSSWGILYRFGGVQHLFFGVLYLFLGVFHLFLAVLYLFGGILCLFIVVLCLFRGVLYLCWAKKM